MKNLVADEKLPISDFRSQIVESVIDNRITIITAETGAGKSTQVPQYLLDCGFKVTVTQPRRLAARSVAERVAEEYGCEVGGVVGYRTAFEQECGKETQCLFVTDGLALAFAQKILKSTEGGQEVLIIDEVHEWNINVETIIALVKFAMMRGDNFRVVLMSATMEAEKLSEFFGGAPIINVPGRMYPVRDLEPKFEMIDHVVELARKGENILVFLPGKAEIGKLQGELEDLKAIGKLNAEVLPLHGELEPAEQRKCFKSYGRPKIVLSTNVAQTSVTIPDITAVIDSGMERRKEVVDGVEGLYLRPISFADSRQRKGRAGRCRPGVYADYCPAFEKDRLEFPLAEIMRVLLDQTVLRLAKKGFDMEELVFFHQPDISKIHEAKESLFALGCTNENGHVTEIGDQVAELPVSVKFGRMLIEADRRGVVNDVLTLVAIMEVNGIARRPAKDEYEAVWKKHCRDEQQSDLMAMLKVWEVARNLKGGNELYANGIIPKAYFAALELRKKLSEVLRPFIRSYQSSGIRQNIIRAVCVGMVDHVYRSAWGLVDSQGARRELNKDSVVRCGLNGWVIGLPFDIEVPGRYGPKILNLVSMATKVELDWVLEAAPHLIKEEKGINPRYSEIRDKCYSTTRKVFQGHVISEEEVEDPENPVALGQKLAHREYMERLRKMTPVCQTTRQPAATPGLNNLGNAFDKLK